MVVRDYLRGFYKDLQQHLSDAEKKQGPTAELAQAFRVISNRVLIVGEISDRYLDGHLTEDDAQLRLKYVYRDLLFTGTMSTIEYHLVKGLLLCPDLEAAQKIRHRGKRRVHLSNLVEWLGDMLDDSYLWDFCIKLRNDIVHDDAIGRQSMESPDIEFPVTMKEGEQAEGVLRSFVSLSRAIERSFFQLVMKLPEARTDQ